jgi:Mor family transcriptional regulator
MADEHVLDALSGDFKKVALLLGEELTLALCNQFGGLTINVPRLAGFHRNKRDDRIRAEFDSGKKVRRLATKYHLTSRRVYQILKAKP